MFKFALNYHSVHPAGENNLSVHPREFERQMAYLKSKGYRGASLEEAYFFPTRENLFGITFDDGYLDNYTYAMPVLKKFGFSATVFLTVKFIGKRIPWHRKGAQVGNALDWKNIEAMNEEGIRFGSHTMTHPFLTSLVQESLRREIRDSKKNIEGRLLRPVESFAYPSGDFNNLVKKTVQSSGYKLAAGLIVPRNADRDKYSIPRIGIGRIDNLIRFKFKVSSIFKLNRFIKRITLKQ